jgi:F0F1-type ATP synthase membrane subunit b/b'
MAEELAAVIDEIRAAKPVPFSTSAMVNRKDLVQRLEELRDNIPLEIKRAAGVVADRRDVLAQSHEEAEAILRAARVERDQLLARTEIVRAASHEADRIIEDAKAHAQEIRMQAEDYVDAKLANFEIVLQKILAAVARGRESLRGRLETAQPARVNDTETTQRIRVRRR